MEYLEYLSEMSQIGAQRKRRRIWGAAAGLVVVAGLIGWICLSGSDSFVYQAGLRQYEQRQYDAAYNTLLQIVTHSETPTPDDCFLSITKVMKDCYNADPTAFPEDLKKSKNVFFIERNYLRRNGFDDISAGLKYDIARESLYAHSSDYTKMAAFPTAGGNRCTSLYLAPNGNTYASFTDGIFQISDLHRSQLYAGSSGKILGYDRNYIYFAEGLDTDTLQYTNLRRVLCNANVASPLDNELVFNGSFINAVALDGKVYLVVKEAQGARLLCVAGDGSRRAVEIDALFYASGAKVSFDQMNVRSIAAHGSELLIATSMAGTQAENLLLYVPQEDSARILCTSGINDLQQNIADFSLFTQHGFIHWHNDGLYVSQGGSCVKIADGGPSFRNALKTDFSEKWIVAANNKNQLICHSSDLTVCHTIDTSGMQFLDAAVYGDILYILSDRQLLIQPLTTPGASPSAYALPYQSVEAAKYFSLRETDHGIFFICQHESDDAGLRIYSVSDQGTFTRVQ